MMSPADEIVPIGDISETVTAIRLAGLIREDSVRILANWSLKIATLPIFRALPELALGELQEDMPDLLDALLKAVSISPHELDPAPMEEVGSRADAHGAKRAGAFPIDVVLSEIQVLQREVRNAIWRNAQEVPVQVAHDFDERLNDAFEIAERSVVAAWVREQSMDLAPFQKTGDAA
jgi:hypothetical protein